VAHPKRKHSHSRTRKRRTHQKITAPQLATCSECKKLKVAHMVCPFCGYYGNKLVIDVTPKEKKKKNR